MKIKKYLLHIGLLIAVIISLIFSAIIWIDPATFHRNTTQTTTTNESGNTADAETHYHWSDVYLPTSVILTKDKQQMQLTSGKEDMINQMRDAAKNVRVKNITVEDAKNFADYRESLLKNDNLTLSYSGPVSIGLFESMLDEHTLFDHYAERTFNHIVLPLANRQTIYLYSDNNFKIYKVELKERLPNKLYKAAQGSDIRQTLVQYQEINKGNYILNYTKGVTVPKYSYLINKENTSLFVTHLLGSSSSNSIATKEHNGITTYTTDNGQRLVIDSKDGTVNYSRDARQNYRNKADTFNKTLKQNFDNLKRIGVALDDVRYQSYDSEKNTVTYQSYINGYPIISSNYYGTYEITMQRNGAMQYLFSIDNLQVPLSNDNQTVNLPPTNDVIQTLKSNNYNINKVKSIEVGYEWSQNPTSQMVVDLTPTYFVNYNGTWINYKNLGNRN